MGLPVASPALTRSWGPRRSWARSLSPSAALRKRRESCLRYAHATPIAFVDKGRSRLQPLLCYLPSAITALSRSLGFRWRWLWLRACCARGCCEGQLHNCPHTRVRQLGELCSARRACTQQQRSSNNPGELRGGLLSNPTAVLIGGQRSSSFAATRGFS